MSQKVVRIKHNVSHDKVEEYAKRCFQYKKVKLSRIPNDSYHCTQHNIASFNFLHDTPSLKIKIEKMCINCIALSNGYNV